MLTKPVIECKEVLNLLGKYDFYCGKKISKRVSTLNYLYSCKINNCYDEIQLRQRLKASPIRHLH